MTKMPHRTKMQQAAHLPSRNHGMYRGANNGNEKGAQETANGGVRSGLEKIGSVITPITLFTALGLYIGWRRTASYAQYFGIDQSVLQYSTQDYLLRSWQSTSQVVFAVVVGSIAVAVFHLNVKRLLLSAQQRWLSVVGAISYVIVGITGAILIVLTTSPVVPAADRAISKIIYNSPYVTHPAVVALSVALLLHFGSLALKVRDLRQRRTVIKQPTATPRIITVLVMTLLFLGLLSASDKYVSILGSVDAEYMAATLSERQGVVVYSKEDLALPKEVTRTDLTGPNQAYHYRYEGLRLYIRSADKYFLLPATWSKVDRNAVQAARLIVLRDDPSLRFEFIPGSM